MGNGAKEGAIVEMGVLSGGSNDVLVAEGMDGSVASTPGPFV